MRFGQPVFQLTIPPQSTDPLPADLVAARARRPLSRGHVIVQRIGPPRLSVRGVANDPKDLLHDITADATGSTAQQILDRGADLCFGVVLIYKILIELV